MREKVKAERFRFPLLGERVRVRGIFSLAGLSCAKVSSTGEGENLPRT